MNLNKIIQEELNKVLNESSITMEHENFKFRQLLNNSTFNKYQAFSNDYDISINESNIIINWHIKFWVNDSDVENFVISVDGVEGTYKVSMLNKQTDVSEQEVVKNISENKWKFEVGEAVLRSNSGLYVTSLDFDFETNICKVQF